MKPESSEEKVQLGDFCVDSPKPNFIEIHRVTSGTPHYAFHSSKQDRHCIVRRPQQCIVTVVGGRIFFHSARF
jgi:hypothetical protein